MQVQPLPLAFMFRCQECLKIQFISAHSKKEFERGETIEMACKNCSFYEEKKVIKDFRMVTPLYPKIGEEKGSGFQ